MAAPPKSPGTLRLPLDEELAERVAWLVRLRWIAAPLIATLAWAVRLVLPIRVPAVELSVIAAAIAAYNVAFALVVRRVRRGGAPRPQTLVQVAGLQSLADWIALSAMVHYTGGIDSPVLFFFPFHAVIASILLPTLPAYLNAATGTAMVIATILAEQTGMFAMVPVPGFVDRHTTSPLRIAGVLGFFVTGIFVTIYLASSIARRLRRRTRELAEVQQDLESAYHRTSTLYDAAKALSSTLDYARVLDDIVRLAAGVVGARAASIRLLGDGGRELKVEAAFGLSPEYLAKGPVAPDHSPLDREVLAGRVVTVLDAASDPRVQYPEECRREGIRSILCVPVSTRDGVIGVLRVYSATVREFTRDEAELLSALASQGSLAIVNARAYRQLAELEQAKSRFVFAVAHQLKSPVAAVQSRLSVMIEGYAGDLTPKQAELLGRARRRLDGLQDLIRDLLALGALRERVEPRRRDDVDLADVVRRVVDLMQARAEEKGVAIETAGLDAPVGVRADRDDMERLFSNLIENAVKYTPAGGRVRVALAAGRDAVTATVSDTGIGIPSEALGSIFDEFYRAQNAKESGEEGTGLGLALVRHIVEQHHGEVRVDSRVGEGTTFTVVLPVAAAEGASAPSAGG